MHILLSSELELLISDRISSGLYQTRAEVIREALRMFFRAEAIREASIARFEAAAPLSGEREQARRHEPRNARLHRLLRSSALARRAGDVASAERRTEDATERLRGDGPWLGHDQDRKTPSRRTTPSEPALAAPDVNA